MKPEAARVDEDTLDALQAARGRVPIEEFRMRSDCPGCAELTAQPASVVNVTAIYAHIAETHGTEVQQ